MSRILIFILRAYQAFLSPLMPGGCKFYPSCSHYAVEAVQTHGALRGAWLAALRVLRCRPFARGGFDPVPQPTDEMRSGIEILRPEVSGLRMTGKEGRAR